MNFLPLLGNLVILGLFIFIARKVFSGSRNQLTKGGGIRRFFQYGLLLALTIISGIGISGLLGRFLHIGTTIYADRAALALDSSFTLVGVPLYIATAMWTRSTIRKDPSETVTFGWNLYLTGVSITALVLNMNSQVNLYGVVIHEDPLQGSDIAQFIVWGAVWFFHFRLHNKLGREENTVGDHLIGSLIGLGFSFVGLITVVEGILRIIFPTETNVTLVDSSDSLRSGLITLLVGAPVWYVYWVRTAAKAKKESIWYAYVLLIGVGGGVLTSVIASSITLYSILVWFFGDTQSESAAQYFHDAPSTLAAVLVGLIVVWYHRDVLGRTQSTGRTEIRRIYEYVIASIGLLAAVGGITMILVSIVQSLSKSTQITGPQSSNTLIVALTLILVGGPIWWIIWKSIQNKVAKDPLAEQSSLVRRIYLFVLFGVTAVASLISLITITYISFNDLFNGEIGVATFHQARFALGILITALFVSIYHWQVYRGEKHVEVQGMSEKASDQRQYFFVQMNLLAKDVEEFIVAVEKYAIHVRKVKGCERFDVLMEADRDNAIFLYEVWSDEKSHDAYLESKGLADWKLYSDPMVLNLEVKRLKSTKD